MLPYQYKINSSADKNVMTYHPQWREQEVHQIRGAGVLDVGSQLCLWIGSRPGENVKMY